MTASRRTFLSSAALACGALLLDRKTASASSEPPAPLPADIWAAFKNRRSVRRFKPDAVPEADLHQILDAARMAPTSGNQQPWKFLVVRDPFRIAALKTACIEQSLARVDPNRPLTETQQKEREVRVRQSYDGYFSAPVYVVVLTDNQSMYPDYNHWDGPMAAAYLMLAARALGYGTVFITDSVPDEITKKVLNIPDRYTRVCITPLGVPVEWPTSKQKKPLGELVAYDTF
jgi:nitroreductase